MSAELPPHIYNAKIAMSCGGCSGAITRVLKNLEGVDSYEVSLEEKSAQIKTSHPPEKIIAVLRKTGKHLNAIEMDGKQLNLDEFPAAE